MLKHRISSSPYLAKENHHVWSLSCEHDVSTHAHKEAHPVKSTLYRQSVTMDVEVPCGLQPSLNSGHWTTKPIETPVDPLRGLRLLLLASSGFTPSFTAAFQQGLQTAHEHFGQLWLFPIQPGQRIYKKSTLEICLLTERKNVKYLYLSLQRHTYTMRIVIYFASLRYE